MDSLDWMEAVVGGDTYNAVATRCELAASTITRQVARGGLSPEVVVAIARAYDVPALPGLVACGLITEVEARLKERSVSEVLARATDAELLREVLARVDGGADVKVVQTMLGHKSATMTLDLYGHLFPDKLDAVARAMESARVASLDEARRRRLVGAA